MGGFATYSDAGSPKTTVYADNVDFSGTRTNKVTANGQLLIGSTTAPNIRVGSLTSSDATVTITVGAGTIDLKAAPASNTTYNGNSGSATPSGNILNVMGSGATTVTGAGSTLTISVSGGGIPFTDKAVTFSASSNNGYFCTAALTVNLPGAPAQGDMVTVFCDTAGAVVVTAAAGQRIRVANTQSSVAGTMTSNATGDSLVMRYRASDLTWQTTSSMGSWTPA